MSYTSDKARSFESTKTSSKEIATKILKKREGEIALGLFKVGWQGERMTFTSLCGEFLSSHTSTLSSKQHRRIFAWLSFCLCRQAEEPTAKDSPCGGTRWISRAS